MRHHTKDKGDLALGYIIGDLLKAGIQVALPLSEHLPFDLIAISETGQLRRVQVKHRAAKGDGSRIDCGLASSWADRNGNHTKPFDPTAYDALAVFCPQPQLCCYLRMDDLPTGIQTVTLRLTPALSNQLTGIRFASEYVDPARMFQAPVTQGIE